MGDQESKGDTPGEGVKNTSNPVHVNEQNVSGKNEGNNALHVSYKESKGDTPGEGVQNVSGKNEGNNELNESNKSDNFKSSQDAPSNGQEESNKNRKDQDGGNIAILNQYHNQNDNKQKTKSQTYDKKKKSIAVSVSSRGGKSTTQIELEQSDFNKVNISIPLSNGNNWTREYNLRDNVGKVVNDFKHDNNQELPDVYLVDWNCNGRPLELTDKLRDLFKIYYEIPIIQFGYEKKLKPLEIENIDKEPLPGSLAKPFTKPFEIFKFNKNLKRFDPIRIEDEQLFDKELDKYTEDGAYCNGNNKLYMSSGDKLWETDLFTNEISGPYNLPAQKFKHSMIYVYPKYVFLVGGNDTKTYVFNDETKEITEWGDINKIIIQPSLIRVDNDLYCFENGYVYGDGVTLEKTNLIGNAREWETLEPIISERVQNGEMNQKYFGISKDLDNNIVFLGGEDDNNNTSYKYNIKNNEIEPSTIGFKPIPFSEKALLPLTDVKDYILPDFQREKPALVIYNKKKGKMNYTEVKPEEALDIDKSIDSKLNKPEIQELIASRVFPEKTDEIDKNINKSKTMNGPSKIRQSKVSIHNDDIPVLYASQVFSNKGFPTSQVFSNNKGFPTSQVFPTGLKEEKPSLVHVQHNIDKGPTSSYDPNIGFEKVNFNFDTDDGNHTTLRQILQDQTNTGYNSITKTFYDPDMSKYMVYIPEGYYNNNKYVNNIEKEPTKSEHPSKYEKTSNLSRVIEEPYEHVTLREILDDKKRIEPDHFKVNESEGVIEAEKYTKYKVPELDTIIEEGKIKKKNSYISTSKLPSSRVESEKPVSKVTEVFPPKETLRDILNNYEGIPKYVPPKNNIYEEKGVINKYVVPEIEDKVNKQWDKESISVHTDNKKDSNVIKEEGKKKPENPQSSNRRSEYGVIPPYIEKDGKIVVPDYNIGKIEGDQKCVELIEDTRDLKTPYNVRCPYCRNCFLMFHPICRNIEKEDKK